MKVDIQPSVSMTHFICNCGAEYHVLSTLGGEQHLEICSHCHPFFTGNASTSVDTEGRIAKFKRRYQQA